MFTLFGPYSPTSNDLSVLSGKVKDHCGGEELTPNRDRALRDAYMNFTPEEAKLKAGTKEEELAFVFYGHQDFTQDPEVAKALVGDKPTTLYTIHEREVPLEANMRIPAGKVRQEVEKQIDSTGSMPFKVVEGISAFSGLEKALDQAQHLLVCALSEAPEGVPHRGLSSTDSGRRPYIGAAIIDDLVRRLVIVTKIQVDKKLRGEDMTKDEVQPEVQGKGKGKA